MTALFVSNQSRNKNLVEFKAGKMNLQGQTVTPDKRKGLFLMTVESDNLLHFKWKDRTTDAVEDDFILFPDDVEFVKVPQCTTGRAFLLRWKAHPRRLFFWMQEPNTDKDEAIFKKVNDLLKNPTPSPISEDSLMERVSFVSDRTDLTNLLQGVTHQDLSSLINQVTDNPVSFQNSRIRFVPRSSVSSAAVSSTDTTNITPVSTPATDGSPHQQRRHQVKLCQLQDILSFYNSDRSGAPTTSDDNKTKNINLANICNADAFNSLKSKDPNACNSLISELPDNVPHTLDEVAKSVSCPQVKYTFRILTSAIRSGRFANAMVQFGLNNNEIVGALNSGDIRSFVEALEKFLKEDNEKSSGDTEMEETG